MSRPAAERSALGATLAHPLHRGAAMAMLLSGIGTSAAAPQTATFLVTELHTSYAAAGLFYLTNLLAPVAGWLVGSRSDHTGDRLGLFRWCSVIGFVAWTAIALSPVAWLPFVISTLLLGFSGAAASQVFAALDDSLRAERTPHPDGVVAIVRMALTAGWVIGPVLGAFSTASLGVRETLLATAACSLLQIVPLATAREHPRPAAPSPDPGGPAASARDREEGIGTGHAPGGRRAALLGVAANLCFSLWSTVAGLFAGQILMGGVWGVFAALGIIAAQRLLPHAVATASAIFMSSMPVSQGLGGVLGGIGVGVLGLPQVFVIPAVLAGVAAVGLAILGRRHRPLLADEPGAVA